VASEGAALAAHLRPVGIELLGDERGQAGEISLPHLVVLADDGDEVVGADAQERVRRQRTGGAAFGGHTGGRGGTLRKAEAEDQAGAGQALQHEPTAEPRRPGVDGQAESARDACLPLRIEGVHHQRMHGVGLRRVASRAAWIAARMR
jgi:hypothetical protein